MIKLWKVTVELNLDASHYESIVVEANTYRKAAARAMVKFKKDGHTFIKVVSIELVSNTSLTKLR